MTVSGMEPWRTQAIKLTAQGPPPPSPFTPPPFSAVSQSLGGLNTTPWASEALRTKAVSAITPQLQNEVKAPEPKGSCTEQSKGQL